MIIQKMNNCVIYARFSSHGQNEQSIDGQVRICTEFAESKNAQSDSGFQNVSRPQPSAAMGDGFMNIPDGIDEELPFN